MPASSKAAAAIGVRMHSGWGALVAVSNDNGTVEVIERRRIVVISPGARGGKQPYHFAKSLELPEAEKYLGESFEAAECLALTAVQDLADKVCAQNRIVGSAVLLASGRTLPHLAKVLASHSLIHAAEGEFYREVFSKPARSWAFLSQAFESVTSPNMFRRRLDKGQSECGNRCLMLAVLSGRHGRRITKWRHLRRCWFWNKQR